jgi:DNA-binding transcriptional ArsR family regulator
MSAEQPLRGDADIAPIAALIGDPTRARVLMALTDGRALPASRLAVEAGVAPSTVSEHLARLLAAGLVTMRPEGRSRFYRLASAEVAGVLEALAQIAPDQPIRSLRQGSQARALREARTCYNHLAGRLGTGLLAGFLSDGVLAGGDGRHHPDRAVHDRLSAPGRDLSYRLTPHGEEVLGELGIDLDTVLARRPAARYCLDWSEQRHHLAGPLGTALAGRLFALGWVRRTQRRRVVQVTDLGREKLPEVLGLPADWAEPADEDAWPDRRAAS